MTNNLNDCRKKSSIRDIRTLMAQKQNEETTEGKSAKWKLK